MNNEAIQNRERIGEIKRALDSGKISYAQAKNLAAPVIESINKKAVELGKKYNTKPRLVSFSMVMR